MTRRVVYRKSETSKQQVLDAALRVFSERGVGNATVQDVADAAGMSKGAVHYHFESKDDLIIQAMRHACARITERVQSVFEQPGLPLERVRRAIAEMWAVRAEGTPEIRVVLDVMMRAIHDPTLKKAVGDVLRNARQQVVDVGLNGLCEMGLKPRVPIHLVPRLMLASLDGLAIHNLFDPASSEDVEEMLKAVERITLALFELPGT
jgi:AcrR family transcriptional regulator